MCMCAWIYICMYMYHNNIKCATFYLLVFLDVKVMKVVLVGGRGGQNNYTRFRAVETARENHSPDDTTVICSFINILFTGTSVLADCRPSKPVWRLPLQQHSTARRRHKGVLQGCPRQACPRAWPTRTERPSALRGL